MSLQVIGAGLGRTGTRALKEALEQLGFAPCYHMMEVFAHPEDDEVWLRAVNGEAVDWEAFLGGYRSSVDWPACHFYRQLAAHCPRAKVILSLRDPKAWYGSISKTIFEVMRDIERGDRQMSDTHSRLLQRLMEDTFQSRYDEQHAIAAYERHNAEVKRAISPERLLIFDVAQGWEPLCQFLDAPVPKTAFPHMNTTAEFQARVEARRNQQAEKQA